MGEIRDRDVECIYCDENWEMYRIVEPLYFTLETNIALYVNYIG